MMTSRLRDDLFIFVLGALPIHLWAYLITMREVPAWLFRLDNWDVVSMAALTLTYALIESIVVLLPLILLSRLIPERFWKERRKQRLVLLIFLAALMAVLLHLYYVRIRDLNSIVMAFIGVTLTVALALLLRRSTSSERINKIVDSMGDRLFVLSSLYLLIDLVALVLVIVRLAG